MKNLLIISLLAIAMAGCGPVLYVPNTINAPLLAGKGDFRANVGTVGLAPSGNADFHGAYGVSEHVGVKGGFFNMNDRKGDGDRHQMLDAGVGTFTSFWENKRGVKIGRAELFGSTGFGWAGDYDKYEQQRASQYTGVYQRYAIQPGVGIRTRFIDLSVAGRLSSIHFSDFQHIANGKQVEQSSFGFQTFEPVMTLSLGFKYVKYYMQMGNIEAIGNPENFDKVTNYVDNGTHFNVGISASPWKEKPVEKPPVVLDQQPTPQPETGDEPAEKTAVAEAPPAIVPLQQPTITICLREGGSPDGDVVSASFNGAYIFREVELAKKPQCFEVTARPGEENLLQIQAISDGKFKPNTVQVIVREGRKERIFYLRTEAGKTEAVRFRVD